MVVGGYILSIINANLSAKKINQLSNQTIEMKLKNYRHKDVSNSFDFNYIPNQEMMASYNVRF